jgi:hypothetical protein
MVPVIARAIFCLAACAAAATAAEEYTWWIDPCTPEAAKSSACESGDAELGRWALEAWQRESKGALVLRKSATEVHAQIKIHWVNGASNLYGETVPEVVDGKPGASIYVLPDLSSLGGAIGETGRNDHLFRDTIVYLTCVHESGHALGLAHTRSFADIMYSFQYGGDFVAYFERYRKQLQSRADIASHSGVSDGDRLALKIALSR